MKFITLFPYLITIQLYISQSLEYLNLYISIEMHAEVYLPPQPQPNLPTLLQQYQFNTTFITNLKTQSKKIEQLLAMIDRLKQQNELKDKQIQTMKRKEIEDNEERIRMINGIKQQHIMAMQTVYEKLEFKEQLIHELELQIKRTKYSNRDTGANIHVKEYEFGLENQQLRATTQQLQHQLMKKKEILRNCKEENSILRTENINCNRMLKEFEVIIKKLNNKIEGINAQNADKIQHVSNQNAKLKEELLQREMELKIFQEHFQQYECSANLKIDEYKKIVNEISTEMAANQRSDQQWKQKYYDLEAMVNHVEQLRRLWRVEKINKNGQAKTVQSNYVYGSTFNQLDQISQLNKIITQQAERQAIQTNALRCPLSAYLQ